jgi:hypothetical protein
LGCTPSTDDGKGKVVVSVMVEVVSEVLITCLVTVTIFPVWDLEGIELLVTFDCVDMPVMGRTLNSVFVDEPKFS